MENRQVRCADKILDLTEPKIMGILNVTPDSFSDGGKYLQLDQAVTRAKEMIQQGAAIIDIGGESSRPHANYVSLQEELERVMPVIEALKARFDILLSIDTYKPAVMQAAIAAGIHIINDIRALQTEDAMAMVANSQVAVCLMHMKGDPETRQVNPHYKNLTTEISDFLQLRASACLAAGITKDRVIIDPGFGYFGKNIAHNLQLLNTLSELKTLGYPILAGLSRKAMLGKLLNAEVDQRLAGSLALAVLAVKQGADIIRAHDVRETADAVKITALVMQNDLIRKNSL